MVLSVINMYQDLAFAGSLVGVSDGRDVETYINNAGTIAGVYDLVFTAVNSATYTANIYGYHLVFTADGSATLAEIRDGLLAQFALQPGLVLKASAAASGNNVRITELAPATNGPSLIGGLDANTALTTVTAGGVLETVEAGIVVCRGPNFQDLRLIRQASTPSSASFPIVGVTIHQHMPVSALVPTSRAGFPPNSEISVLKRGKIMMLTETAIALGDTPFVRFAVGAGGSVLGRIRNTADSASAVNAAAYLKFMSAQATAGGLVTVSVGVAP